MSPLQANKPTPRPHIPKHHQVSLRLARIVVEMGKFRPNETNKWLLSILVVAQPFTPAERRD